MRTIKTIQDIHILREASVFSNGFMNFLEEEFLGLKEAFDFDGLDEAFTLEYGYLVILQRGDNLRDLSVVGLKWAQNGLLGCMPEYIERNERAGEVWYKVVVVFSNDDGMIFYVPEETVANDDEIKTWLEENVE
ncbi:hypothetical protein [Brevibacillus borstelensis]|uniref:hypothetical protein n=1 Tax=Brevibacillus TaxID=55080 RepID=UPI0015629D0B|nr:hypothetical protein [Brevibacillus borstelensis]MBE5395388.1 hypothetical protein [Brevibacillus borstelensis]